jgi:hypothetical protein
MLSDFKLRLLRKAGISNSFCNATLGEAEERALDEIRTSLLELLASIGLQLLEPLVIPRFQPLAFHKKIAGYVSSSVTRARDSLNSFALLAAAVELATAANGAIVLDVASDVLVVEVAPGRGLAGGTSELRI